MGLATFLFLFALAGFVAATRPPAGALLFCALVAVVLVMEWAGV